MFRCFGHSCSLSYSNRQPNRPVLKHIFTSTHSNPLLPKFQSPSTVAASITIISFVVSMDSSLRERSSSDGSANEGNDSSFAIVDAPPPPTVTQATQATQSTQTQHIHTQLQPPSADTPRAASFHFNQSIGTLLFTRCILT